MIGQPPFTPLFAEGGFQGSLANFALLLDDELYFDAILASLGLAVSATTACLLIGYPMAWGIAGSPMR